MILICGASGLVGKEMCRLLDNKKVEYIGTYNKNKIEKPNMYQLDFSNAKLVEDFLILHKITFCIFSIVERLTDVCENNWNEIKKTNIEFVHITSYLCNKLNIKFIHLSTDYVFDGSIQPNLPDSLKNPLQNYGISKLISEYRLISNCKNYCIIRTPVLYTELSKIHDNAVTLIGKNIMDLRHNIKKEDNYSIRRPLYIRDLCVFIYDCLSNNNGIYHFYNPYNKFTKYEICQKIGKYLDIEIENISKFRTLSIVIVLVLMLVF
jgi:dTDP-4-dehydrorhamnose reductase